MINNNNCTGSLNETEMLLMNCSTSIKNGTNTTASEKLNNTENLNTTENHTTANFEEQSGVAAEEEIRRMLMSDNNNKLMNENNDNKKRKLSGVGNSCNSGQTGCI